MNLFIGYFMYRIPEELPTKDQIHSELRQFVDHMTSLKFPLVLSHNDMWFGNIILDKTTGKFHLFISKQIELLDAIKICNQQFSGIFCLRICPAKTIKPSLIEFCLNHTVLTMLPTKALTRAK